MNRLEERLRDAFGAAAETVRPESAAGLRARPATTGTRRLAPLAAAAAVAVIVIGASVSTPLLLAGGQHARPSSTGTEASSATPVGAPASVQVLPMVVGMSVNQGTASLAAAGLQVTVTWAASAAVAPGTVIAEEPAGGTHVPVGTIVAVTVSTGTSPSVTITLQPTRLVTVSADAVTIRIPRAWRPTSGIRPVVGYHGVSGWVQVQGVTEPAGVRAACTGVAAHSVSHYGRRPAIRYLRIDGRPGCEIVPGMSAGGTAAPMISALVEYRSPLTHGANFLLISADPADLLGMIRSIRVHH
ncbi:MAG TPA: PASTA domain-containing protein [Streptosporangiaceae bacterium]|nr:PASTA domain-containing protein [Streptosporangiaceae bacterium]